MSQRREFFKKSALIATTFSFLKISEPLFAQELESRTEMLKDIDPKITAKDEEFWAWVRDAFTVNPNVVNLNNGGVSPQPKVVQDAHIRNYQFANEGPSYFMWRIMDMGREPLRAKLASVAGCNKEEIAINRNATEGLNTIIFGLDLKAGDEVVLNKYDYPNMMNAWKQRAKRDGIVLKWVEFDLPSEDDKAIVDAYRKAITEKTKVVHVTHIINWMGQILPVRKIADMAHEKGCEVIVDGAHSFALLDFKLPDLGADYFATSLHKWMNAPFGSGMMYIRQDKITKVWALLSAVEPDGKDIRKFESLGTRSFAAEMAIGNAIDFHLMIGAKRKEERLHYLKNYWIKKVKNLPGVEIHTSTSSDYSCAIGFFSVKGLKGSEVEQKMFNSRKIHTVAIEFEKLNGVRVTPSIYTSTQDLDLLVETISELSAAQNEKK
jgi:selenocysteine lyase/cysteine desulfurase